MENNIKQIGERLKGLREIFNISAEEVAELCEVSLEHYLKIEAGEADPSVDRGNDYKYQSLAGGFRNRKVDPFLAQVDPLPGDKKYTQNTHDGQEFDFVLQGTLELTIEDKVLVLEPGDSIYFDSKRMHCFRALNGKPATFVCIIV